MHKKKKEVNEKYRGHSTVCFLFVIYKPFKNWSPLAWMPSPMHQPVKNSDKLKLSINIYKTSTASKYKYLYFREKEKDHEYVI